MADEEAVAEQTTAPEPEPELVHGAPVSMSFGQTCLHPARDQYLELMTKLRDEDEYRMCVDLTACDYLTNSLRTVPDGVAPERFEVVVNLLSLRHQSRLRVRVQVPETNPVLPSLYALYPGTEAMEREVFDLFGISFTDHPDLSRILMPDDWEGHPLRKDYGIGRIPVQFKEAR
jgi:NADH-quinone oxidoreductase subunit C